MGAAIDVLTRTGQMCDDTRQEFILPSDVPGVSMLAETVDHRTGGTSTVREPCHMVAEPVCRSPLTRRATRRVAGRGALHEHHHP